jgi:hypothetical protein
MRVTQTKTFKLLLGPAIISGCLLLLQYSFRWTGILLFVALLVMYVNFLRRSNTKWMRLIFVALLVAVFLPIDVTLTNYPGPPRFVPLVLGAPNDRDIARERRGEVVLGGCIMHGNDPKWVLVW